MICVGDVIQDGVTPYAQATVVNDKLGTSGIWDDLVKTISNQKKILSGVRETEVYGYHARSQGDPTKKKTDLSSRVVSFFFFKLFRKTVGNLENMFI